MGEEGMDQVQQEIERRVSSRVAEDIRRYAIFLDRVCEATGLHRDEAALAAAQVLCVFEQRISDGEIRHLEGEIPGRLRALLAACEKHPGKPPMRFGRAAFFRTLVQEMGRSGREVGRIVSAVLAGVREQISEAEAANVASQLPDDLRILWAGPSRTLHAQAGPRVSALMEARRRVKQHKRQVRRDQTFSRLVRALCHRSGMDEELAERGLVSVVGELRLRLTPAEVADLDAQLPSRLVDFLPVDERAPGERPEKFHAEELFIRVAHDLSLAPEEAVPIVHFVFSVVREHISRGEAEDVGAQLPTDIAYLWDSANDQGR